MKRWWPSSPSQACRLHPVPERAWAVRKVATAVLLGALGAGVCTGLGAQTASSSATASARTPEPQALQPLQALPALEVGPYMGRWYQVAYYPNFFQKQCVSDTTATYRELGDGTLEVLNRCRTASGAFDQALGLARPVHGASRVEEGQLRPARLEVSFLPSWLRWLGVGWGAYWVVDRPDHGRYAIISEPRREYLWVLARTPQLTAEDRTAVRARLLALGFDLERLKDHSQGQAQNLSP